mmetsp:Transcript_18086/g.59187  ORF Transcript_18086/g.59187 Transcript_18086/m.59187 type:complete len:208 (+) Transcript_18086:190-813(+)
MCNVAQLQVEVEMSSVVRALHRAFALLCSSTLGRVADAGRRRAGSSATSGLFDLQDVALVLEPLELRLKLDEQDHVGAARVVQADVGFCREHVSRHAEVLEALFKVRELLLRGGPLGRHIGRAKPRADGTRALGRLHQPRERREPCQGQVRARAEAGRSERRLERVDGCRLAARFELLLLRAQLGLEQFGLLEPSALLGHLVRGPGI